MRIKIYICLFFMLVAPIYSQTVTESDLSFEDEFPLRCSEPADTIISDLKKFIPNYMRNENIPGVQIALIYAGKIAWTEGFGVTNTISKEPVTSNTVFEVASLSKVVSAYMALKLVDDGKISLEKPLHHYLTDEWLPPSVYRDSIKLSHVLSHSSGLGKLSKDIMFKPGTAYYYSANGFNLLKKVMEEVTGEAFEALAQRLVFKPIGMTSSSFIKQAQLIPQTANGHLHALVITILFGVFFTVFFVIVLLISLAIIRLITKSWRLKRAHIIIILSVSFILLTIAIFIFFKISSLLEFGWLIILSGIVLLTFFLLIFYTGHHLLLRLFPEKKGRQRILSFMWAIIIVIGMLFFSAQIVNLPVPRWPDYDASPAGTLRTSAQDLALFLIEISNPQFLKTETAEHFKTSQIKLSDNLAWGMGPGILYSNQGYALWQWGQHIDFQSIMIVYPEHKFGIVLCTNNDLLNPDVAVEIAHYALGGMFAPLRMAIHLQYDYQEKNHENIQKSERDLQ